MNRLQQFSEPDHIMSKKVLHVHFNLVKISHMLNDILGSMSTREKDHYIRYAGAGAWILAIFNTTLHCCQEIIYTQCH